jgi:hypothetical protein
VTRAQLPPSLPLAEEVRWRHALVYQPQTAEEAYAAGVFAERLRRVAAQPIRHCACARCGSFTQQELDSLARQLGRRDSRMRDIKPRVLERLREQGPQTARQLGMALTDIPVVAIRNRLNEMRKDGRVVVHTPRSKLHPTVWAVPEKETT